MSRGLRSSLELEDLLEVVERLRDRVERLEIENGRLERRVGELEAGGSCGNSSFEVVTPISSSFRTVPLPIAAPAAPCTPELSAERVRAAESIGGWLQRCLSGLARGNSGRDKVDLPSKLYLVAKDIFGNTFDPPQIYYSWNQARARVSKSNKFGDSVFVGFPTVAEARIALIAAGLQIPAEISQR